MTQPSLFPLGLCTLLHMCDEHDITPLSMEICLILLQLFHTLSAFNEGLHLGAARALTKTMDLSVQRCCHGWWGKRLFQCPHCCGCLDMQSWQFLQILLQTTATMWPITIQTLTICTLVLFILVVLIKYLEKCHLKEKGLLEAPRSRVKFSMTEASEKQKFEGTGHIPSTVRKTNDKCSLQLQFLTAPGSPGSQAEGDIMRLVGPLTSTDAYKTISLAQLAQRSTSWIILDFAKLTINSNHHNNPIVTTFAFFFLH